MSETDFAHMAVAVAECFWGEPNKQLTTKLTAVWGSQGSRKLDIKAGTWFDHECQRGGGVIDLVMTEKDCTKGDAVAWLEAEGFIEKREREQPQRSAPLPAPQQVSGHDRGGEPPAPAPEAPDEPQGKLTAVEGYDYADRDGNPLYQVVRYQWALPDGSWVVDPKTGNPKKTFRQRRKDAAGNVIWNLDGIGHTIYRHNEVEIAIAEGKTILLPEGEKDAKTFVEWGLCGTTNSGGAQHWQPHLAEHFRDADVVIPVDNDDAGIKRGEVVAKSLRGIAKRIRVLNFADHISDFPKKGDVTDWRDRFGGDASKLVEIINTLSDWKPEPPVSKFGAKMVRSIAGSRVVYDWLIKGMVERGGVFVVAGEQQAGKSFFMIDLGMKIARGIDYCRKKVRQGLVIHHAGEDYRGVLMRVEGYRRHHQLEAHDLAYVVTGEDSAAGTRKLNLMNDDSV
ncbi:MAG: AAA family ATPase, partial [Dehalococcoidia bacterium]